MVTDQPADRMLRWRHSGFSVHNRVRSKACDAEGRQRFFRYMIRCPFALEKMRYDKKSGMVIYRSRLHATLNTQLPADARSEVAAHAHESYPRQV